MIVLKSGSQIDLMRRCNAIVAEVLAVLSSRVRPGVTTAELDEIAERETLRRGARPAFKGYRVGDRVFPSSLCISINDEIVHGVPTSGRALRAGDIVGLDFGVCYQGYFGDSAVTVGVGEVDPESQRLMRVTQEALWAAIDEARIENRIGDLSAAVQDRVEREGFSVVRDFVGHGIGTQLHEEPQVPNFGTRHRGLRLRAGMVLAIEPMVNVGGPDVVIKEDGWTAVTKDGRRSAHFEHSVAITDDGPFVLSAI